MRIAVLDCGAVVCKEGDQEWLFGAPEGVDMSLKEAGIEVPNVCFQTSMRAPGYGKLGKNMLRFKEQAFSADGFKATPVKHKHGTDYAIESADAKVLFSERGDVSVDDTWGYDLAIIKNKHRADDFKDNVITWPWTNSELEVIDHKLIATEQPQTQAKTLRDDLASYCEAFKKQFPSKDNSLVSFYVDDVDDVAGVAYICGMEGNYAVPYTIGTDGEITYAGRDEWQPARQSWTTVVKEEDLSEVREKVIKHEGEKWCLYTKDGKKKLGEFDSEEAAVKRERQIQYFKHAHKDQTWEISVDEMENICPDCAKAMKEAGLESIDMGLYSEKAGGGNMSGLAKHIAHSIGADPNFFTKCTDSKEVQDIVAKGGYDLDAFCAKAHKLALGRWPSQDQDNKKKKGEKKEKEWTDEGPVRRLGDAFTAALHTAYNDFADRYFAEGYMSQDERMVFAHAIGEGLNAVQKEIPEDLYKRPLDKPLEVPAALKELAPNMPETITDGWSVVYKEGDQWRWATVSSTAVWDLQKELFPPEAMDWALKLGKVVGMGPLRFKHIPGLDGGECDRQVRVGDFLFESGYFYDTPLGLAMKSMLESDPGWKISVGLAFGKDDLVNGKYKKAAIFERSITKSPANPWTSTIAVGGITMKQLTEQELKSTADELGLDLDYVKTLHEKALAGGQMFGLKEFQEFAAKESKGKKKPAEEPEEEEEMMEEEEETSEKELQDAIAGLNAEQRKTLRGMLDEAEESNKGELQALKGEVDRLAGMVGQLVTALGESKEKGFKDNVREYFNGMPRRQAKQFASDTQEDGNTVVNDDAILAKLKELETIMKNQDPLKQMYDSFTSRTLNQKTGGK